MTYQFRVGAVTGAILSLVSGLITLLTGTLAFTSFGRTLLVLSCGVLTASLAGGLGAHLEHDQRFNGNDAGRGAPLAGGFGAFIGIPLLAGCFGLLDRSVQGMSFQTGVLGCSVAMVVSTIGTTLFNPEGQRPRGTPAIEIGRHIGAAFGSAFGMILFGFLTVAGIKI